MTAPHDWDVIAASEAFYGVITDERFRADALSPERIAEFYATGEKDIAYIVEVIERAFGAKPQHGAALDIGCGVGRLARAMRPFAARVIGYDVSTQMLSLARRYAGDGVDYVSSLPEGPLAWINSYIVLQHIPPPEGLDLIKRALALAGPGCFASLHVTAWRDEALVVSSGVARARIRLSQFLARRKARPPEMLIQMHDYALNDVMRAFVEAGFGALHIEHTNHGGHHGAWIFARKPG